jgi:hypothetical protein
MLLFTDYIPVDALLSPLVILFFLPYLFCSFYIAWIMGRQRKIGFFWSLVVCLITSPLFGFFIVGASGLKNAKGCAWCGNTYNEAEFCGKNEEGEMRAGFISKKK